MERLGFPCDFVQQKNLKGEGMSCIKTLKSKCVVLERNIVESKNLCFDDLGLLVRILAYEEEKLNIKKFCDQYHVTSAYLLKRIYDLEHKGFIISRDEFH